MGVIFLEHPGGQRFFCCGHCKTAALTNRSELISTRFTGATGRAFLFRKVCNVQLLKAEAREMMTGRHMVRDVVCKQCSVKLGWFYEFAMQEEQRYKEGHFILERALIVEKHGRDTPTDATALPAANLLEHGNDLYL